MGWQADQERLCDAVTRTLARRSIRSNWTHVVEPKPGASEDEIEVWLHEHTRRAWGFGGGVVGFADQIDAARFKLVWG